MAEQAIYPLRFTPLCKDYPWGGRSLYTRLGRQIPPGIVAESWEIAAHANGATPVADGPWAGKTLLQLMAELGTDLVGSRNAAALQAGRFPLLIKLLDAHQWLSVQVHPGDSYALAHGGDLGKSEMWVILHAEPGAELIFGLRAGATRDAFALAVAAGRCQALLHRVPARAGDVFFVPAGAVHALGPGLLVAEIQQNSDTTYRIDDWGRLGSDGRPRALHIDQALAVMDFGQIEPGPLRPRLVVDDFLRIEEIGACAYFSTERISLPPLSAFFGDCDGESYEIWGLLAGTITLTWSGAPISLTGVDWLLLPAALGEYQLQAQTDSTLLRIVTPASG